MTGFIVRKLTDIGGKEVTIRVGVPVQEEDGNGDWICIYSINGLKKEITRYAIGVDGVQAITLALIYIATSLYYSEEYENGNITWLGSGLITTM